MNFKIIVCAVALLPLAARAQDATQPAASAAPTAPPSTTSETKPAPQATTPAPLSDKLLLRLRLQPNQAYDLRTTMEVKQTQIVQGQKTQVESTSVIGARYEVQSVAPDGTTQIKLTYTDMSSTHSIIANGKRINAAHPLHGQALPNILHGINGLSLTMTLAPDGRVIQAHGLSEMLKRVLAEFPAKTAADRQATAEIRTFFAQMFSEKGLTRMMAETTTRQYPPTALGIGDSWTRDNSYDLGFSITSKTRNTLVARAGGIATVNQAGALRLNTASGKNGALKIGSVSMRMNLSGATRGSRRIDEASGLARYAHTEVRMSGRIQVRNTGTIKPGEPRETSFPIYQLATSTVTMQPIAAPATSSTLTP